jgi:hypothetical protein
MDCVTLPLLSWVIDLQEITSVYYMNEIADKSRKLVFNKSLRSSAKPPILRPGIYACFSRTNASLQPSPHETAITKDDIRHLNSRMQHVGTTNRRDWCHLILLFSCISNGTHIFMDIKVEKLKTEISISE